MSVHHSAHKKQKHVKHSTLCTFKYYTKFNFFVTLQVQYKNQ